ncbi:MAG: YlxR family protein [Clostridia bacterium]|nr:YlxR family protein [Clostridia bacterium]
MMKQKKIPLRMCAGCGEMKPKKELVRVVRAPVKETDGAQVGGEVSLDLTGRKPGRGAYVCRDPECLKKAQKARRFERAFSCRIEDAVYDAMYNELCADTEGGAVKE